MTNLGISNIMQNEAKVSCPAAHMLPCYSDARTMLQVLYDTHGLDGAARPHEFDTGMDAVPEAVDMAVRLMTPGELSLVRSSGRLAYDRRADRPEVDLAVSSMAEVLGKNGLTIAGLPYAAGLALHHSATC